MDEKIITKIAKQLVKDFLKEKEHGEDFYGENSLRVGLGIYGVTCNGVPQLRCRVDGKEMVMPYCTGYEYASLANGIFAKFKELVAKKLHGYVMHPHYKKVYSERYSVWSSPSEYDAFSSVTFYKPCAEWKKVVRRLDALKIPHDTLEWDWRTESVGGKRSSCSVGGYFIKCASSNACTKLLEALKGLKKAEITIKKYKDMDDMQRGIEYETEWSGSIEYALSITSSKGHVTL